MKEIFNLHDVPYLTKYLYKKNEDELRKIIYQELEEDMNNNIELEK